MVSIRRFRRGVRAIPVERFTHAEVLDYLPGHPVDP